MIATEAVDTAALALSEMFEKSASLLAGSVAEFSVRITIDVLGLFRVPLIAKFVRRTRQKPANFAIGTPPEARETGSEHSRYRRNRPARAYFAASAASDAATPEAILNCASLSLIA